MRVYALSTSLSHLLMHQAGWTITVILSYCCREKSVTTIFSSKRAWITIFDINVIQDDNNSFYFKRLMWIQAEVETLDSPGI